MYDEIYFSSKNCYLQNYTMSKMSKFDDNIRLNSDYNYYVIDMSEEPFNNSSLT